MKEKQILIYDDDSSSTQIFEQVAYQFQLVPVITKDLEEISKISFDYAIISEKLPKVIFNDKMLPIITIQSLNNEKISSPYCTRMVLTRPINRVELIRMVETMISVDKSNKSFFGNFIDVLSRSKEMQSVLSSILEKDYSLNDAINNYCLEQCKYSKITSDDSEDTEDNEVSNNQIEGMRLLSMTKSGSIIRCHKPSECNLIKFQTDLLDKNSELLNYCFKSVFKSIDPSETSVDYLIKTVGDMLNNFSISKRDYCISSCSEAKHDLDFQNGNHFLSDIKDVLQNKCSYCTDMDCQLDHFFSLFRYMVVSR